MRRVHLVVLASLLAVPGATWAAGGPLRRFSAAGGFELEIDGSKGRVKSVAGGGVEADVVTEVIGEKTVPKKHLGPIKYEDITVQTSLEMPTGLSHWIDAMLSGNPERQGGSVAIADVQGVVKKRLEFQDALLTEIGFPAMDASSKDAGYLTVTWSPETSAYAKGDGSKLSSQASAQKAWLPSNFRLSISGGVECKRVSKIDAFTIKQSTTEDDLGEAREFAKEPGKLEIPNLVITVSAADLQTWQDWFDDFVIKGNNADSQERKGTLEFLSTNLKDVLATLELDHVGIRRLVNCGPGLAGNEDGIPRFLAEIYVEEMTLVLKK